MLLRVQPVIGDSTTLSFEATSQTFGPLTTKVVKAVQAYKRLTADGIVGANTWSALDSIIASLPADSIVAAPATSESAHPKRDQTISTATSIASMFSSIFGVKPSQPAAAATVYTPTASELAQIASPTSVASPLASEQAVNYTPYVIGGVVVVGLLGAAYWYTTSNSRE